MNIKMLIAIIGVLIVGGGLSGYFLYFSPAEKINKASLSSTVTKNTNESPISVYPVNKQASFAIFTNGTFRIFSAPMYHNLSKVVFIEAENPNIIKVKREGVTWNDFFKTLPFTLTNECLVTGTGQTFCSGNNGVLKFYLNGVLTSDLLNQKIRQDDQVLVTFGEENEFEIQKQLQQVIKVQ